MTLNENEYQENYDLDDTDDDQLRLFRWHERRAIATTPQWAPRRPDDVVVSPKYL